MIKESVHYVPIQNDRFSYTFEFWVDSGKLYCRYNNSKPEQLKDLLKSRYYPELKDLMKRIYDYIASEFKSFPDIKRWKAEGRQWEEILFLFIAKKFRRNTDPLDIIISTNGAIKMNFDERKVKSYTKIF